MRHFTAADGLPSGKILKLYQDSRGFLWACTLTGLSRFDGKRFVNYSTDEGLAITFTDDLSEDKPGNLYVNGHAYITRFDGQNLKNFTLRRDGFEVTFRDLLCLPDNRVLAMSRDGICLIDGDSIRLLPNPDKISYFCCIQTRDGRILMGGSGGVYEWKNNQAVPFIREAPGSKVLSLLEGADSCLWYGLLHTELKRFPLYGKDPVARTVEVPRGEDGFVAAFMAGDSTHVLVATQKGFLIYRNGVCVKRVANFLKIKSDMINSLFCDRDGNIWVGSLYGLWRFTPAFAKAFPNDSIYSQSVVAIQLVAEDSVLFTDGFYQYAANSGGLAEVFPEKPIQVSEINDIFYAPDGYVYFGSSLGGLMRRNPKGEYKILEKPGMNLYRCFVFAESEGYTYMGTDAAYVRLKGDSIYRLGGKYLTGENVLALDIAPDHHYVGTNNTLYEAFRNGTARNYKGFFDSADVLITDIRRYGKRLYVSTKGKGLLIASITPSGLEKDTFLTKNEGLPSNYISSVIVDQKGQIWISTYQGLCKAVADGNGGYSIRVFNANQGVPEAFWESCRFVIDKFTGKLWIGSSQGLLLIDPSKEFSYQQKPGIQLEEVRSFEGTTERGFHFHPGDSLYSFPYSANHLEFRYTAIQLSGAEKIQYFYRLEGRKNDWLPAPQNGILELQNLSPGTYKLTIRAFDPDRSVYSNEAVFRFVIERPFWMSGWFYFLIILVFLGLVYVYFKWRVERAYQKQHASLLYNRQLAESRYLAFQARMNPHFIFNSLNAIQFFITKNDKSSSLNYLSKFARLLRQVLDNTKASKMPLQEEIDILKSYLEMESMRFDGHFRYEFQIDPQLDPVHTEVPGMLLQPFVENAIVHGLLHLASGEGVLLIKMKPAGSFVLCSVEDNGVGRARSAQINARRTPNHKSHGMEIARNRLQLLVENVSIDELIYIEDLPEGKGTIVHIKLPIL